MLCHQVLPVDVVHERLHLRVTLRQPPQLPIAVFHSLRTSGVPGVGHKKYV